LNFRKVITLIAGRSQASWNNPPRLALLERQGFTNRPLFPISIPDQVSLSAGSGDFVSSSLIFIGNPKENPTFLMVLSSKLA
jgi:hypothetical protein